MLVHAKRRWPTAITANLWPYTFRHANNARNHLPQSTDGKGRSPLQLISGSNVDLNPKQWMPFGCPTYTLNPNLQAGKPLNKWGERSRVGIYLGMSPNHARNMALVLSLQTGLASPQFHIVFDPRFRTITARFGDGVPKSEWQRRCHLLGEMDGPLEGPEHMAKTNAHEGAQALEVQWETLDNEVDDVGEQAKEDREDTVVDGPPQEPDVSRYGRHHKKT
jgi:hypothetical protein